MKRYLAMALGVLGLGGCAQANRAGELLLNPPLDLLQFLRDSLMWLANVFSGFLFDVVRSLFL